MRNQKPLWWGITIFGLSVLYLVPESIFNSQLVATAGSDIENEQRLKAVEFFGRAISGFGVTLLFADAFMRLKIRGRRIWQSRADTLIVFVIIGVLIWPTVYFGQKWLIETYLVDASSPQQRQQAFFSQLLKAGFTRNVVKIDGIPDDPKRIHSSAEMTFLTLFSGLVYADPNLDDVLRPQYKEIVTRYIRTSMSDDFDVHYANYKTLGNEIDARYSEYSDSSKQYYESINNYREISDKRWAGVQVKVEQMWKKYNDGRSAYIQRAEKLGIQTSHDFPKYLKRRARCRNTRCKEKLDERYIESIEKMGIGSVMPNEWLIDDNRSYIERNTSCRGKKCTLSINPFDLFSGLFGDERPRKKISEDPKHYEKIILNRLWPEFSEKSGYEHDLESLAEFRAHKKTSDEIRKIIDKQGVKLSESWRGHQKSEFYKAVRKKVGIEADRNWQKSPWKSGFNLKPGLSRKRFEKSDKIQMHIKNRMGDDFYVRPTLTSWNDVTFVDKVIEPNVQTKTQEVIELIQASVVEFADGGSMAERGRDAIRSTLVPPISMILSLILVIITIIKLPVMMFSLCNQRRRPCASNETHDDKTEEASVQIKDRIKRMPLNVGIGVYSASIVLLILLIPILYPNNVYTQSGSPVNYFIEQIEHGTNAVFGGATKWALQAQPIIFPIGEQMENGLSIMILMDNYVEELTEIDEMVLGLHSTN